MRCRKANNPFTYWHDEKKLVASQVTLNPKHGTDKMELFFSYWLSRGISCFPHCQHYKKTPTEHWNNFKCVQTFSWELAWSLPVILGWNVNWWKLANITGRPFPQTSTGQMNKIISTDQFTSIHLNSTDENSRSLFHNMHPVVSVSSSSRNILPEDFFPSTYAVCMVSDSHRALDLRI